MDLSLQPCDKLDRQRWCDRLACRCAIIISVSHFFVYQHRCCVSRKMVKDKMETQLSHSCSNVLISQPRRAIVTSAPARTHTHTRAPAYKHIHAHQILVKVMMLLSASSKHPRPPPPARKPTPTIWHAGATPNHIRPGFEHGNLPSNGDVIFH